MHKKRSAWIGAIGVCVAGVMAYSTLGANADTFQSAQDLQSASAGATLYSAQIKDDPTWLASSKPLLGNPRLVITRSQGDDAEEMFAVDQIHSTGAKAYRYVQFFWNPELKADPNTLINLADHPDWAYCNSGQTPLLGRVMDGDNYFFLDLNEREVGEAINALYENIKSWGYDGVFVDLGRSARSGRKDWAPANKTFDPKRVSTCTDDPQIPGRTFADSYIEPIRRAKQMGLSTVLNFDQAWVDGMKLPASWVKYADWTLDENVNNNMTYDWWKVWNSNRAAEVLGHGQTIQYLKEELRDETGNLTTNKNDIYFRSARAKLFSSPIAVNAYDPRLYPELASATLNGPFAAGPFATYCENLATGQCLWGRRYSGGMALVNNTNRTVATGKLVLGTIKCRAVTDLYSKAKLSNGACLTSVNVTLPPRSGRILQYNAWS